VAASWLLLVTVKREPPTEVRFGPGRARTRRAAVVDRIETEDARVFARRPPT